MKSPILAVLVALAAACSHAPARRTVIVEGWAGTGAGADRRAISDALKRAVEQAGGVRVDARTRVDKGMGIDARVVTRAAGCILEYKVLDSRNAEGGRAARVRAVISPGGAECAGRTSLPPAAFEDSTVSVRFTGEGPFGADAARSAESALRAALAAQGIPVEAKGGDYRVTGTAVVSPHRDPRVLPFIGARVEMTVRVVCARDGRVVREARHEAAALGADGAAAARVAAAEAARAASSDALIALDEAAWLSPAGM
ncbi:MAG: hypothetical protein PHS14_17805, partial [Elusimicrobia bacterium]|nr:hypothetical protein [Elusimicrobiota bacterium]